MTKTKVWIFTAISFVVFLLIGWLVPALMHLEGSAAWILRGGIWFLGLIATLLVFLLFNGKAKASPAEPQAKDEIDVVFAAARSRLASAKGKAGARFGRMPLIIVAGPGGSAKTTVITRSGMEPELLAGEVYRGDAVVPTSSINLWFAQNNLVLEAGGKVAGDAARWKRLIRRIQPNRLAAAFTRGRQAPRIALICIGCDELLKPGASESVPAMAQRLRARLAEVSQQIGIRLPVYVVFTKTDRLPYFEDYVRSLTRAEAQDVLGTTLTLPPAGAVGDYAERESRRLADAFSVLFRGMALRRLDLLARENAEDVRAGAYEFPREFRKITDLATQFLLDLCRPSQLGVSPFLRGFYFSGVRPVFVHDAGAGAETSRAADSSHSAMDATGVFDPRMLQQAAAAPQRPAAGSRKVPEWAFIERVFADIILADNVARAVTGGGTRVNMLRRASVLVAAIACLVLATGFTISFFANRAMLRDVGRAVEGARAIASVGQLPDPETLLSLDSLRVRAGRLDRYAREGNPLHLNWGLYAGSRMQPDVRRLYFQKFDLALWARSRNALLAFLHALPATPTETSDYDRVYEALKAYIVTTERPEESRTDFLEPTLLRFWRTGLGADSSRVEIAGRQFAFFADELQVANPYEVSADSGLVDQTRRYLGQFGGQDQFYRVLLAVAGDSVPPVSFSDPIVRNDVSVPGAFTEKGWSRAQLMLTQVDSLLTRETWVVGEGEIKPEVRADLEQNLRTRYTRDYTNNWIRFLQGARIAAFGGLQDASQKLLALSGNPSPMLAMLQLAADNTAVDDTIVVGPTFKPLHDVAPAKSTAVSEPAGKYLAGLLNLQNQLGQVAAASGPPREQARLQANSTAQQIKIDIGGLARTFNTEGDARFVGLALTTFMQSPITSIERIISALPADQINSGGSSFCAPFNTLTSKFPFNRSGPDASLDDMSNVLRPDQGALWTSYASGLQDLLMQQGTNWVARPGAPAQADPRFVAFFDRAAAISRAFYDDNGEGPRVDFTARAETSQEITQVTVSLDGRRETFTPTQAASRPFAWTGGAATGARIDARVGTADLLVAEAPPGPWATFRLFYQATFTQRGNAWVATWSIPGHTASVSVELSFVKGQPIFRPGYLSQLGACPTRIVR
jgi:type VI secretion system protein ImpL